MISRPGAAADDDLPSSGAGDAPSEGEAFVKL
ncbi:MAG: hypothetical protein JWN69_933, partial [Alphaproteobacteria bacterium]|nr:hypothetical protein [Alphaproteobacteria bacterium]